MPRHSNQNTTALRAALLCDIQALRAAAEKSIRRSLQATSFGDAADRLGVPRRALERIRELRPDLFE
jgi:hypothetical protein